MQNTQNTAINQSPIFEHEIHYLTSNANIINNSLLNLNSMQQNIQSNTVSNISNTNVNTGFKSSLFFYTRILKQICDHNQFIWM